MKRVLLILLVGLTFSSFAQKDANTLKQEGNEAYKSKDYAKAFTAYAEALKLNDKEGVVDEALIYNTGYCAYKAKKYKEAIPYFQKSIELGYKESKPYQMVAVIQYKLGDVDGMIKTCTEGLQKYPNEAKLKDYASKAYLKKGLAFYSKGSKIKKAANESGLNESDPEKFKAEYAKADDEFKKALPLMEKSYEYNSKNKKTIKALQNIYTNLEMSDKAAKMKAELEKL
jgi:pilus assembly protein Flp/PilA